MTRYEFTLPDVGEGLQEAVVVEWHVEPGETVCEDELVCDVETEKAVVEIPAPCDGIVETLRVGAGERIAVGDTIAVFETDEPPAAERADNEHAETAMEESGPTSTNAETPQPALAPTDSADSHSTATAESTGPNPADDQSGDGRVVAMPSTRRYARNHDIDITAVEPANDRVTRADIDRARNGTERAHPDRNAIQHPTTAVEAHSVAELDGPTTREPLTGIRKRISEKMVESKTVVPHVSSGYESNASGLLSVREQLHERYETDVSYTALLMKAVVPSLQSYPVMNAEVDDQEGELVKKEFYNIGFAVHTDDGLVVPVVDDVDEKSIIEVERAIQRSIDDARAGTLSPADVQGGTFTISNLGGHDEYGQFGTPIINYPQVAVLGLGQIQNKPVAINESDIGVRKRVTTSLSFDHRVIDGVDATEFMTSLLSLLEDRDRLLTTVTP